MEEIQRSEANTKGKLVKTSQSPEAAFISALVNTEQYIPGMYGIKSEYLAGHKPVHEFCLDYQEKESRAPTPELLKLRYPNFPYLPDIGIHWATSLLSEAHTNRILRTTMANAVASAADDANDEAIKIIKSGLLQIQPAIGMGVDATDLSILENNARQETCPVPSGMLSKVTGGIAPGDLWIVAARLGIGKSWKMIEHAVTAAENGWNVAYFSLEMSASSVIDRIHRVALKTWKQPWHELGFTHRGELLEKWAENAGTISVFDPSDGRCDASVISAKAEEKTLVVVDYVGLMYTTSGSRAIEDWRAMATISNQLKEVALERNIPIITAAQINRSGTNSNSTPGPEHLAQSDALGQDADALITLKRFSKHVLLNSLPKYRHGESGVRWYTKFDPVYGQFNDISIEDAQTLKMKDEAEEDAQTG